jgi:hypothetical protein
MGAGKDAGGVTLRGVRTRRGAYRRQVPAETAPPSPRSRRSVSACRHAHRAKPVAAKTRERLSRPSSDAQIIASVKADHPTMDAAGLQRYAAAGILAEIEKVRASGKKYNAKVLVDWYVKLARGLR